MYIDSRTSRYKKSAHFECSIRPRQEGQEVANILQELISNQSNITSATLPFKSTPTRDLELTKPEGMFGFFK
jgi:hypothetical protein